MVRLAAAWWFIWGLVLEGKARMWMGRVAAMFQWDMGLVCRVVAMCLVGVVFGSQVLIRDGQGARNHIGLGEL